MTCSLQTIEKCSILLYLYTLSIVNCKNNNYLYYLMLLIKLYLYIGCNLVHSFLQIPRCCSVYLDFSKLMVLLIMREKEGDLTQSYDKTPYTNRTFENQRTTHTNATKNFDYTTIADRLRTVSWSNK